MSWLNASINLQDTKRYTVEPWHSGAPSSRRTVTQSVGVYTDRWKWWMNSYMSASPKLVVIQIVWSCYCQSHQQNVLWTLGDSGSVWELPKRIPGWSNPSVCWANAVAFRNTGEHLGAAARSLGEPTTSLRPPWNAGNRPGSTCEKC